VQELEERLGARLLHRTTRRLGLTEAGTVYYEHCQRIARELEQAHIWDVTNGARFSTYAIRAEAGSGVISLNGGAARHVQVGDIIIIAAFASMSEAEADSFQPRLVYVDGNNRITHTNHSIPTQAA